MKKIFLLITFSFLFSCKKDKVVLLPEISHSEITEILDVSPAYLFYDETKTDSVELNRKNLIVTTNWLVNVDKRLTLKQVIPHIKFLQEKKANSSHKNESAKNYFTCNDTNRKNLGFIEFTNVVYNKKPITRNPINAEKSNVEIWIDYQTNDSISVYSDAIKCIVILAKSNSKKISNDLAKTFSNESKSKIKININFNSNLTFQDYITFKSTLSNLDFSNIEISKNEFISNY